MGNRPSYYSNTTYYQTRPVEQVSYNEIRENPENSPISPNWPQSGQVHVNSFMGKLRDKTEPMPWEYSPPDNPDAQWEFDLPTEAQWEYACRAGTTTALNSGKDLTNSNSCPNVAEMGRYSYNRGSGYSSNSDPSKGTALVGSYLPNGWGIYDMHGNVWEWCLDKYDIYRYKNGIVSDPVGATSGGINRVTRGGGGAALHQAAVLRVAPIPLNPAGQILSVSASPVPCRLWRILQKQSQPHYFGWKRVSALAAG
jgi:hypothetical protein